MEIDSIFLVGQDPNDPRRPVGRTQRRRRDTEPGTPRAIAEGSGIHDDAVRVARAMLHMQMRAGRSISFGGHVFKIERHDGAVALVLPDGTLLIGDDDQAAALAEMLTTDEPDSSAK